MALLTELEAELSRRKSTGFQPKLFAQQTKFIEDPSKTKCILAGRRAGKSTTAAIYLIRECLTYPNARCVFIALTLESARTILWKELKNLNEKFGLGMRFNGNRLTAEFPSGSYIKLVGGNDPEAVEGLRGTHYRLAVVDESASYRGHLPYLLDEVLTPALMDDEGTLCLLGTPAAHCKGIFFDATTGAIPGWSVHHWTVLDNPFMPHARQWLADLRKKRGYTEDNPIYQREWMGRWVKSAEGLVYRYTTGYNDAASLPVGRWHYIMGIDVGFTDPTAWVIVAYRENDPTCYFVESFAQQKLTVDQIMDRTKQFIERFKPDRVVMDSGGGGKLVYESFRKRYQIPIYPAQKQDKLNFIEQMNADFVSQRIRILPGTCNEELKEQWQSIQWDEDPRQGVTRREDPRWKNDIADAALYAWRESPHYAEEIPIEGPKPHTPAWYALEEQKLMEACEASLEREHRAQADFDDPGDFPMEP